MTIYKIKLCPSVTLLYFVFSQQFDVGMWLCIMCVIYMYYAGGRVDTRRFSFVFCGGSY